VTQNVGFGAYTRDFTFFMDGGTQSWANSKESVIDCIADASETVRSFSPDFVLFQEVDTDSTRSYHIDQRKLLDADFATYSSVGAVNYHSAFLFWPLYQPHGICNSQIVTYSSHAITSSVRRSLPISTGFSKLLDLDRCYSVSRIPVEGDKELVLYNVHLSAYGSDDSIRTAQMTMLFEDMQSEYEAGNYCVCGGDFNHDFTGTSTQDLNGGSTVDFGWAQPFPDDLLSQYAGVKKCVAYDGGLINPTCRNCDVGYSEGNFTIIVDGFLVSANVSVSSLNNIVTGFEYSDHNPVVMKFSLN
jgi:endonuclease/exonuclease/phosphatase family metal-dependent hydrolase